MPASTVVGQKRAAPETKQVPAKRARPDASEKAAEDTASSISKSDDTSSVVGLGEEDVWDDWMREDEILVGLHTPSQEPAGNDNVPQEVPEEVPMTGVSSWVQMTIQDRMLQEVPKGFLVFLPEGPPLRPGR